MQAPAASSSTRYAGGRARTRTSFDGDTSATAQNFGSNPYPYPPLMPNEQGVTPLGRSRATTPDYAHGADARRPGATSTAHLIEDVGMDMIWQDMMCPALDRQRGRERNLPARPDGEQTATASTCPTRRSTTSTA